MRQKARALGCLWLVLALSLSNLGIAAGEPASAGAAASKERRLIVQLAEPPLALYAGGIADLQATSPSATGQARLQMDAPSSRAYLGFLREKQATLQAAIQSALPEARIEYRYGILFNGLAVRLPDAQVWQRLGGLPGVAAVYPEREYRLALNYSAPQIGAPALWSALGGQDKAGEGIKIAIIDSGIWPGNAFFSPLSFIYPVGFPKGEADYTTAKVIAARAYFRPDDPPAAGEPTTPLDGSFAHGTHVSGIAAGNADTVTPGGVLSGIAPRAWLMNYKAFYYSRSGKLTAYTPELLAAMEDAVADGADICNGSWGGVADYAPESDPLVQGVEAMVRAGVVAVFAAGNEGPKSGSADSPGIAPSAIAVGAVSTARWGNQPDVLSPSSSRGPGLGLRLKPDLVAPGAGIYSSYGNSFSTMSGTSMASPHVAGAAALLRQMHPQWTPAQIKSALMSTANTQVWSADGQDTLAGVMGQGAGRIDLSQAGEPGLYLSPPSFSFGEVKAGEAATMTLAALNLLDPGTYTLTIEASDTTITLWTADTSVSFAAGEQKTLALRLIASAEAAPGDYEGRVWLDRGGRRQHVTWWARVLPAQTAADVLLLDDDGSSISAAKDYRAYYVKLCDDLGLSYAVWDVGEKWRDLIRESGQASGALPATAALKAYRTVVWFTGDNRQNYQGVGATEMDRAVMLDYIQTGGRLLACGRDFGGYSFVYGKDTANLFGVGLGIEIVAQDVFALSGQASPYLSVEGVSSATAFRGMRLDLGASGAVTPTIADGAGNQFLVDELAADADYDSQPILRALVPGSTKEGIIATAKSSGPQLERPTPAMPPGRAVYLAFGLEGVNDAPPAGVISRRVLFQRLFDWLRIELNGTISDGTAASPNSVVVLTAEAESSLDNVSAIRYRWDLGNGSAVIETTLPSVAAVYGRAGIFHPRVEMMDPLGHTAVSAPGTVVVNPAPKPILQWTHLPLVRK